MYNTIIFLPIFLNLCTSICIVEKDSKLAVASERWWDMFVSLTFRK